MQPAPAPVGDRAPDERGQVPAPRRDLLDQETDQERVVGGRQGVAVLDVHLELGDVVLASPALHVELTVGGRPDHLVGHPVGIDGRAGPVHPVGGHRDGAPAILAVWLHEVELELVGDLRHEAARNPWFDGTPECEPRVHRTGRSPRLGVPHAHHRVRLPSGPHRIDVQVDLDVGQPDVELEARDGEDLPIEREGIDPDAERGPTGPIAQEVFASFQPQDVRVHQPELLRLWFHPRSFGAERTSRG